MSDLPTARLHRPSIAVYNNTLTVSYNGGGTRYTYSTQTGDIITTNTTIPLIPLPWAYHAESMEQVQIIRYTDRYIHTVITLISP